MADPFVWFDLRSADPAASRSFYEELLGWNVAEVPVGDGAIFFDRPKRRSLAPHEQASPREKSSSTSRWTSATRPRRSSLARSARSPNASQASSGSGSRRSSCCPLDLAPLEEQRERIATEVIPAVRSLV